MYEKIVHLFCIIKVYLFLQHPQASQDIPQEQDTFPLLRFFISFMIIAVTMPKIKAVIKIVGKFIMFPLLIRIFSK